MEGRVVSIHVGRPRRFEDQSGDRTGSSGEWESAIRKRSVDGAIHLGLTNFEGDEQADKENHGGPDKAVCAYPEVHYPSWREQLQRTPDQFPYGSFGENVTLSGLNEQNVCIGDRFEMGDAVVQVSQPRQPCWKLARRWNRKSLVKEVQKSGRTGWYFRVLKTGKVSTGDSITRLSNPFPEWTIAEANEIMENKTEHPEPAAELATCPLLALPWRESLAEAAETSAPPEPSKRSRP